MAQRPVAPNACSHRRTPRQIAAARRKAVPPGRYPCPARRARRPQRRRLLPLRGHRARIKGVGGGAAIATATRSCLALASLCRGTARDGGPRAPKEDRHPQGSAHTFQRERPCAPAQGQPTGVPAFDRGEKQS
jgi:hypothetical protein